MTTTLTPTMAIHLFAALGALLLGPLAIWARRSPHSKPALHRWTGRLWVLLMLGAALSAMGIRHSPLAMWQGFSLIHLFVPLTLVSLAVAMWAVATRRIGLHRRIMQSLFVFALVVPGAFTLLPSRYLGDLVWGQWLGWM